MIKKNLKGKTGRFFSCSRGWGRFIEEWPLALTKGLQWNKVIRALWGETMAVHAQWEQHSWLLLLLLSSWLFVLHECPEAPAEKGCHCTKHCINIVRGSFAMNNLCLIELGNVKTKRRNSSLEGWDWVLNDWLCFAVPLASLRTRPVFQDEVKLTGNFRLWGLSLWFGSLLP